MIVPIDDSTNVGSDLSFSDNKIVVGRAGLLHLNVLMHVAYSESAPAELYLFLTKDDTEIEYTGRYITLQPEYGFTHMRADWCVAVEENDEIAVNVTTSAASGVSLVKKENWTKALHTTPFSLFVSLY